MASLEKNGSCRNFRDVEFTCFAVFRFTIDMDDGDN